MSLLSADTDLARNSYYAATVLRTQHYPALQSQVDCDVAVVGGGLAGLSAAIELADRGYRVVLLEARQVGSGASGRNGGQAIVGLACEQGTIEEQLGLDEARRIWGMTIEALDLIRQLGLAEEDQSERPNALRDRAQQRAAARQRAASRRKVGPRT
jgi:gamma-glutamylputrescine oxidase